MDKETYKNCPKCGALMDPATMICVHCGYESVKEAEEREQKEINDMHAEHQRVLREMPGQMIRKNTKKMAVIIAVIVFAVVSCVALAVFLGKQLAKEKYDEKSAMIDHLEELYQKGDYEEMQKDYYDSGFFGASFGKYGNTAEVYNLYDYVNKSLDLAGKPSATTLRTPESLAHVVKDAIRCIMRCRKFRDDGFIYGEKDAVELIESRVTEKLHEWKLSDKDIEEAIGIYVDYKTDYTEFAKRMV